ncbi:dephospho-CoA kinase [Gammaproteobacteria bacterium 45_16_T64]|nr:dephospho-CoA kinase [Gammaproteobacteria bacterium 45_16_T64]
MLVIGITGGIGSGKTAVTNRFQHHGITVVDADLASRIIVEPGRPALLEIEKHFGKGTLLNDGSLDRRALRDIVFNDPNERKWLEKLTHPLIGQEIITQIQASQSPYTILVSPLLLESAQHKMAQRILVVDAPVEVQVERTVIRDKATEDGVKAIIKVQMERELRLSKADDIIINDKTLDDLYNKVDTLHKDYIALTRVTQ